MKEDLAGRVRGMPSPAARNLAREYLQARILGSLQRAGAMIPDVRPFLEDPAEGDLLNEENLLHLLA